MVRKCCLLALNKTALFLVLLSVSVTSQAFAQSNPALDSEIKSLRQEVTQLKEELTQMLAKQDELLKSLEHVKILAHRY